MLSSRQDWPDIRLQQKIWILALAALGAAAACNGFDGPTGGDDEPIFTRLEVLDKPVFTRAVATDPGGRWLVALNGSTAAIGDSIFVFDLATNRLASDPLHLEGISGVEISPDGAMAIVTGDGLFETIALSLPDLSEIFRAEARNGRQVVRTSSGSAYFVGGSFGIHRVTPEGVVLKDSLGLQAVVALAVTSDETTILTITTFPGGPKLHAIGAVDLERRITIGLPFTASVLVPLRDPERVLVLGTTAEHPFRGPIVASVVDWASGTVGSARRVADGVEVVYFGTASPWIENEPGTVLVVSSYGSIVVNTATEEARLLPESYFEGGAPCCAITHDPSRGHIVATERRVNFEIGGRPVIYSQASTPDL